MLNLTIPPEGKAERLADLYRAERTEEWGMTEDGKFVAGLVLTPLDTERPDFIGEELSQIGTDANIILPRGGLTEGAVYRAVCVNEHRDWETGTVDFYDIKLVRAESDEEPDPVEVMEAALERSGIPT